MNPQIRDKFYDDFLKEPTKDNFRAFLKNNCGELDEVDFKEQWISKGHLAKTILAMANSRGGIIPQALIMKFLTFRMIHQNIRQSKTRNINC